MGLVGMAALQRCGRARRDGAGGRSVFGGGRGGAAVRDGGARSQVSENVVVLLLLGRESASSARAGS
jgi:hypothetical protein